MAMYPKRKATPPPIKWRGISSKKRPWSKVSLNFKTEAPSTAGKDSKNENSADFSLGTPLKRAVPMVNPDLEIPGKRAKA